MHQIVSMTAWGQMNPTKWEIVRNAIAAGGSFEIQRDAAYNVKAIPGKASLKIKVGKKRKLVTGKVTIVSIGKNLKGEDEVSVSFMANQPRTFG